MTLSKMNFLLLLVIYQWICVFGDSDIRSECGSMCPDNWIRFQGSCYYIGYSIYETFVEAAHYCRQHHAHLIHINSDIENKFIKSYLQKTKADGAWLGLQDMDIEGIWRWYDDDTIATFTDWHPGEPGGSTGENCAVLEWHYLWQDFSCSSQFLPICEREMTDVNGIVG